jgi:hypothetical protein
MLTGSQLWMEPKRGGGESMEKITVYNKGKETKDWVDWNEKMFEDIREGMFQDMGIDEIIQWVEQKLKDCR